MTRSLSSSRPQSPKVPTVETTLELELLRMQVKDLQAQLSSTTHDLHERTKLCVSLEVALQREVGKRQTVPNDRKGTPVIIEPLVLDDHPVKDPHDDTRRTDAAWTRLRVDFLKLLDEVARLRQSLQQSDRALEAERRRRLTDIESVSRLVDEKENEISNLKSSSDAQTLRGVHLEDQLAKLRQRPFTSGHQVLTSSASVSYTRSPSPPIAESHTYARHSYFGHQQSVNVRSHPPMQFNHATVQSTVPLFSPILMSRQILPQPTSLPQHAVRSYSGTNPR